MTIYAPGYGAAGICRCHLEAKPRMDADFKQTELVRMTMNREASKDVNHE
jgi:hypothetical protein